jgi:hypothetical protein
MGSVGDRAAGQGNAASAGGAQQPGRLRLPDPERAGGGPEEPERVPAEPELWFDTRAAGAPAPFTLGNAPNLRADGTHHVDINIAKNFALGERVRLQFRGEMYNFTNTPQFAPPGLTAGAAGFGQVNGTRFNGRRNVQLGLKLLF